MTTTPPSKLTQWYCAIDGRRRGPLEARELKDLADRAELKPDDLVWRDDSPDWVKASTVKGLFPAETGRLPSSRPAVASAGSGLVAGLESTPAVARVVTAPLSAPTSNEAGDVRADRVSLLLEQIAANTHRINRIRNLDDYTITDWMLIIAKIFVASLLFQFLLLVVVGLFITLVMMPFIR